MSKDEIIVALHKNNPDIDLVGEYKGKDFECQLKCNKHNIYFSKKTASFLYHKTKICPKCLNETKSPSNKKYSINDIELILTSMGYIWINKYDYKNASSILVIQCKKCGNIARANITSLLRERKCRHCIGLSKKTTDVFNKEVYDLVGNEYTVLGTYIDNKTHIEMKHNKCGYRWSVLPTHFLCNGRRCPKCSESKGEKAIAEYLSAHRIKYLTEYSFDDCRYKRKLRFDFYLVNLNVCIEFQGKQHYVSVDYMGGQNDFSVRKIRDNIKCDYCKRNNIQLIEIPYNQIHNIDKILNKRLFNIAT
ncbi:MAG: hypothetical protein Q4G33_12655 [bacterium]|nr:hypothetical protein [bacterium]